MNEPPITDALIVRDSTSDLGVARDPEVVLSEAQRAAAALKRVIDAKPKRVMFNGEVYVEFEDWETIGRFYGVSAKVVSTNYVEFGDVCGFEARAVAIHNATGQEVSAAESLCLRDEPNWAQKPLFQLKSMAQTRACAKALRNVLAWVVVLAGYKPTPAEEMDGMASRQPAEPRTVTPPQRKSESGNGRHINERQVALLFGKAKAKFGKDGYEAKVRQYIAREFGLERETELTNEQLNAVLAWLNG